MKGTVTLSECHIECYARQTPGKLRVELVLDGITGVRSEDDESFMQTSRNIDRGQSSRR